jgi:hypothetical protein
VSESVTEKRPLGRDQFREKKPRRTAVVDIPELGGQVIVQAMTARERGEYEAQFITAKGEIRKLASRTRELLAIASCVDSEGVKIFTNADLEWLGDVDAKILERITKAAQELSDISDKDLDDLAKN